MKIDAILTVKNPGSPLAEHKDEHTGKVEVPVDLDYVSDYDDVIKYVEGEISERWGLAAYNSVDFEIDNADELIDEITDECDESDQG